MELYDFPLADNLHFFAIKLLSYVCGNWAAVLNLYFLLTFPLTTLSALIVFRRFGCGHLSSLLGSLLFAFLPYHFMRGEIHLFLASYYLVPLMIMLILEVFLDAVIFSRPLTLPSPPDGGGEGRVRGSVARVVICILVASAGVYYTFFGCFLLLVAGLAAPISGGPSARCENQPVWQRSSHWQRVPMCIPPLPIKSSTGRIRRVSSVLVSTPRYSR